MVNVPVAPEAHSAIPFAVTVTAVVAALWKQAPQVAESGDTDIGVLLKWPVAVNWTCSLGKFCASAVAGVTVTVCNMWDEEPQARSTKARKVRRTNEKPQVFIGGLPSK